MLWDRIARIASLIENDHDDVGEGKGEGEEEEEEEEVVEQGVQVTYFKALKHTTLRISAVGIYCERILNLLSSDSSSLSPVSFSSFSSSSRVIDGQDSQQRSSGLEGLFEVTDESTRTVQSLSELPKNPGRLRCAAARQERVRFETRPAPGATPFSCCHYPLAMVMVTRLLLAPLLAPSC